MVGKDGRSAQGFTLLEVLIALAILSVALGTLYQIFSARLHDEAEAMREMQATLIAQSLLARVGADLAGNPGESSGDAHGGFIWKLTIIAGDALAGAPVHPVKVDVTVAWHDATAIHSIVLHSTRLVGQAALP